MREEQSTNSPVCDDGDVAVGGRLSEKLIYRADNSPLRIRCTLPAADAFLRSGEELIRQCLEFLLGQVTGGGTVVLS